DSSCYSTSPVTVAQPGLTAVSAGGVHTCAIQGGSPPTVGGTAVYCWGNNTVGQLGTSVGLDIGNHYSPVQTCYIIIFVCFGPTAVTSISAGTSHTCAVVGGAAQCWGLDYFGQLGD